MSTNVNMKWTEGMAFEADINGHTLVLDADGGSGGLDKGPRAKALVLGALGGCTGMDVVALLHKMRVDFKGFEMNIEGDLSEEHPKIFHTIRLTYIFYGKDLPIDKLEKAVSLSKEKYCSVSAMLRGTVKILTQIEVKESV